MTLNRLIAYLPATGKGQCSSGIYIVTRSVEGGQGQRHGRAHMLRSIFQALVLLLLAATAKVGTAQTSSPELKTLPDVSNFMQTYYLHPQPELIGNLIEALHPSGFLQKPNNINPVIGFFSEIFTANPNRLPQWQVLIAKQDEQTKAALDKALSSSKSGGVLNINDHAAGLNDVYWPKRTGRRGTIYQLTSRLLI